MNPRPERHSNEVFEAAFETFWPKIKAWVGQNDTADEEDSRSEAHNTLSSYRSEADGYRLAKEFDDWGADASLVEVMDNWSTHMSDAYRKAVRSWSEKNPITPRFKVGDTVRFDASDWRFEKKIRDDGKILSIDTGMQEYVVNCPALGHIIPDGKRSGVTGTIKTFESIHELNQEQANAT